MVQVAERGELRLELRTPMTAVEARELTDRINRAAGELWRLLLESYEREAWRALGYKSWREYAQNEFTISKSRAYQILDQGRVIAAITEAAGLPVDDDFSTMVELPERAARDLKPDIPAVTTEIRERVEAGEPPAEVVSDVVERHRETAAEKRRAPNPAPDPTPDPDPSDDDAHPDVDPIAEWERAEKRVEELEAMVASFQASNDLAAELVTWRQKYAQLEGRLQREITTRNEAEKEARYAKKKLAEIRKELGVIQDRDILPAIRTLREWAGA